MKFMIPIFVGATIGYITNWLAIKMLFRPYEKKFILGVPMPFTPGLIPKEQGRIARSVGETVGDYLLSEDIIMENIEKASLDERLELVLRNEYKKLLEEEKKPKDLLDSLGINVEDLQDILSKEMVERIILQLEEDTTRKNILKISNSLIDSLDYEGAKDKIVGYVEIYLDRLEDSEDIDSYVGKVLSDSLSDLKKDSRKLGDFISDKNLEEFIVKNTPILVELIKDCIDDFTVADRVKDLLNRIIEKNLSRTIRMFLSPDLMSEKIYRILEEFIYSEDFGDKLSPIIISLADRIVEYDMSSLAEKIEGDISKESIGRISSFIAENLIYNRKEDLLKLLKNQLEYREEYIRGEIKLALAGSYDRLLADKDFRNILYKEVYRGIGSLLGLNLSSLALKIDGKYIDEIINRMVNLTMKILNDKLPGLLDEFNIAQIVEDEINKFEVDFAEEVILEIASKELKAITWLGALLGAIMGIISPLLQMW